VSAAALGGLEPIAAAASGGEPIAATTADERVQQLQALLAQVEHGSAGGAEGASNTFASALHAAQAGEEGSAATSGTYTPALPTAAAYTTPTPTDVAGDAAEYAPLIEQAAARYGVDPAVLSGLIQQESGFDPSAHSSAGALGLTQLMPSTAASLGVTEPLNPAQSIEGGASYLSELLHQFAGNTADALAAYNAGPGAVEQYGGVPPYPETQQYVAKVLGYAASYDQSGQGAGAAGLSSTPAPISTGASEAIA
jgi:soluble lytic murein transglycosylase-like protein